MSKPSDDAGRAAAVFAALGDPTRLQLVLRLRDGAALSATMLAQGAQVSRQAVVKHLRVLHDAELVQHTKVGRDVLYALSAEGIVDAQAFLQGISAEWDRAIGRLRRLVEDE